MAFFVFKPIPQMLNPGRLKSRTAIKALFETGRYWAGSYIGIKYNIYPAEHSIAGISLMAGYSVPRKKFARAVDRNRIKRVMREAFRHTDTDRLMKYHARVDLMIVYKGDKPADFAQLSADFQSFFEALGRKLAAFRC